MRTSRMKIYYSEIYVFLSLIHDFKSNTMNGFAETVGSIKLAVCILWESSLFF